MKIGITGAHGFIGSHLSRNLRVIKGVKILSFDLPDDNLVIPDVARLKRFVKNADIIIHAAAINRGTDAEVIAGSVVATYNLAEAVKKYNPCVKIIFLSSIQAETDSLYGRSKRLAENLLEELAEKHGVSVSIFRLTNIFGEGGRPFYNSVVSTFASEAINGHALPVSNPKRKLRLLHVSHLVREVTKEVLTLRKQKFYFKRLDSKSEISVGALAELMIGFASGKWKPKNAFERELHNTFLSYARHK